MSALAERALNIDAVQSMVGLSRASIWRLESRGKFPRRRQLSPNRVCWLASEIEAWLRDRPVAPVQWAAL